MMRLRHEPGIALGLCILLPSPRGVFTIVMSLSAMSSGTEVSFDQ